jgi:hypothetical protein
MHDKEVDAPDNTAVRALHEAWLAMLPTAVVRLDGNVPVAEQLARIESLYG